MKKEFKETVLEKERSTSSARPQLVEGEDYYHENGLMVFTAHFLSKRGYCCGNGCRHCPYQNKEFEVRSSEFEVS